MLKLRALICADPVALEKWPTIVEHIVQRETDKLRIKTLFTVDRKYDEAILETLNFWNSYGKQRVDLLDVLRRHRLGTLSDKIVAEGVLPAGTGPQHAPASHSGVWFDVGEVVYNFTGRESELKTLHQILTRAHGTKSAAANIVSICGLGGIGKSSFAREYAHRHRNHYDGNVAWINAETDDSMKTSFVRLADRLGLGASGQESNEEIARKVYQLFREQKSLFIFDNVNEKPHFKQFQPKIENPAKHTPCILVTTRRIDVASLPANQLNLNVFTMDEAIKLIQKQILYAEDACAQKLAIALQMLPLALQQALAYINDRYTRDAECISKYLKEFEVSALSAQKLLADERFKDDSDYSLTTYATWGLTLARIRTMETDGGDMAIRTIEALAYLNPDLITVHFVRNISEGPSAKVELGLKLLERFSMIIISAQGEKIAIHRLVQKVVRMGLGSEQEVKALKPVIEAIRQQFIKKEVTDYKRECMSHGLHLFPIQVKQTELMKDQSGYLSDLCYFLFSFGNYSDALFIAEQSSAAYESMVGEEHEKAIKMKWRTADAHSALNNYTRAMQILEFLLPISKSKLGHKHWLTLNIMHLMADVHNATGDYQKAILISDEIIPVQIQLLGENHHNVLIAKSGKAIALQRLGKLNDSLELFQDIYKNRVELHGKDDWRTLNVRENIGLVFNKKRQFGKAIEIWNEVYEGWLQVFDETHPEVIKTKKNIEIAKADLSRQRSRSWCRLQ